MLLVNSFYLVVLVVKFLFSLHLGHTDSDLQRQSNWKSFIFNESWSFEETWASAAASHVTSSFYAKNDAVTSWVGMLSLTLQHIRTRCYCCAMQKHFISVSSETLDQNAKVNKLPCVSDKKTKKCFFIFLNNSTISSRWVTGMALLAERWKSDVLGCTESFVVHHRTCEDHALSSDSLISQT